MTHKHLAGGRLGLSIIEVLFAIGVLTIGLLGIAAVLPIGTKNASTALRIDATTAAVENQFGNALAHFQGIPQLVDVPISSQSGFEGTTQGHLKSGLWEPSEPPNPTPPFPPRYPINDPTITAPIAKRFQSVSIQSLVFRLPKYDPIVSDLSEAAPFFAQDIQNNSGSSSYVPAFCVDPVFLAASDNLRPDQTGSPDSRGINSYDRTLFPCYDFNYNAWNSPSDKMQRATSWPLTPRMLRVSASSTIASTLVPPDVVARSVFSERDTIPLARPKDRTLPPSLFFRQVGASSVQADSSRSGNYSSIIMFVPTSGTNYDVFVVVYESRQLTQFNPNTLKEEFPLNDYSVTTQWPLRNNTNYTPQTYSDEVMGIVTDSVDIIRNGVGRFTFAHSNRCNPEIKVGQWVMLARESLSNHEFGWYRVSAVLSPPRLPINNDKNVQPDDEVYVTEVEVRGKNWIFHNDQVDPANPNTLRPYPNLDTYSRKRQATIVVKAPRVVSVSSFSL